MAAFAWSGAAILHWRYAAPFALVQGKGSALQRRSVLLRALLIVVVITGPRDAAGNVGLGRDERATMTARQRRLLSPSGPHTEPALGRAAVIVCAGPSPRYRGSGGFYHERSGGNPHWGLVVFSGGNPHRYSGGNPHR